MNFKRSLILFSAFILTFAILFSFSACGITPPSDECTEHTDENGDGICDNEGCGATLEVTPGGDTGNDGYFNENGELILYRDGAPTFQFVAGVGISSDSLLKDLAKTLSDLSEGDVKVVKASDTADIKDVEIIFGTVSNRGNEYKYDVHTLGIQGYAVKQIGTKIFVVAGHEDGYTTAIQYLKSTVFGITKTTQPFGDLVMEASKNKEMIQDNYAVKDVTLGGESIRGYSLVYNQGSSVTRAAATDFQTKLYEKCGIWLDIVRIENLEPGTKYISFVLAENDGTSEGFYFNIDDENNASIVCQFESKYKEIIKDFFEKRIFDNKIKGKVTLAECTIDMRNVTYEDYGAVGDGETDDFFAIKACHDDANANKLIVHANPSAKYYIGNANGTQYITVKTNTYWYGCTFIFDDENVPAYGNNSGGRTTPIFYLRSDNSSISYTPTSTKYPLPITSLEKGQENIGWEPGSTVMLIVYNSNVKHYIRYGSNENEGDAQHELILVDKYGNVDKSTPIQWDYKTITKIECYNVDDTPIEVRGEGENGEYTKIETRYNNGPNAYLYYNRNIQIARSNVVLSGIEHFYTNWVPYEEGGKGCPYTGFTKVSACNNVIIENMIFECPEGYYDKDKYPGRTDEPNSTNMGSYEIAAQNANNVLWRNCRQSNFFEPDGSKSFDGMMGTNFCKNLAFDNMFVCSFDAHCGVYNVTIKNSTVDHLNFIGDGLITIEDVVIFAGGSGTANTVANLRYDYGGTWAGDLYIDGLIFKYPTSYRTSSSSTSSPLTIVKTSHYSHNFGYTCYYPQNITIKNILCEEIGYSTVGDGNGTNNRVETHIAYNSLPVYVFSTNIGESKKDFSHNTFGGSGSETNINPVVPTIAINHYTTYTREYAELGITNALTVKMPTSPTFKKTEINIITEDEE